MDAQDLALIAQRGEALTPALAAIVDDPASALASRTERDGSLRDALILLQSAGGPGAQDALDRFVLRSATEVAAEPSKAAAGGGAPPKSPDVEIRGKMLRVRTFPERALALDARVALCVRSKNCEQQLAPLLRKLAAGDSAAGEKDQLTAQALFLVASRTGSLATTLAVAKGAGISEDRAYTLVQTFYGVRPEEIRAFDRRLHGES